MSTPTATPVSSTATRRTASRSSSERTLRPIEATSRSRSSASASASAERVRSSASAASAASAWRSESSSPSNSFGARVVARTSTAGTLSSETSGTKTALFAPTFSASRRLTRCEPATSYTTTGPPSKTALAIPDGSCSKSTVTSRHQEVSLPGASAWRPCAREPSSLISATAAKSTSSSERQASISVRATRVLVSRAAKRARERGDRRQLRIAGGSRLVGLAGGRRRRLSNSTTSKEHQAAFQGITGRH